MVDGRRYERLLWGLYTMVPIVGLVFFGDGLTVLVWSRRRMVCDNSQPLLGGARDGFRPDADRLTTTAPAAGFFDTHPGD